MAKERMVNTRFWVDPWVQEELNTLDRLLFLYFLTNDQTNISGIYEISMHKICFETGIEKETLVRAMIPRLAPKIYMEGNWVILVNFPKHQNLMSEPVMKGIHRELANVPDKVYEKAIGYGYPIHRVGDTKLNLTKLNLSDTVAPSEQKSDEVSLIPIDDDGDEVVKVKGLKKLQKKHQSPLVWDQHMLKLKKSPIQWEKAVWLYCDFRGLHFTTWEQWEPEKARYAPTAKKLVAYPPARVTEAMHFCEKNYDDWTIETVLKCMSKV